MRANQKENLLKYLHCMSFGIPIFLRNILGYCIAYYIINGILVIKQIHREKEILFIIRLNII